MMASLPDLLQTLCRTVFSLALAAIFIRVPAHMEFDRFVRLASFEQ